MASGWGESPESESPAKKRSNVGETPEAFRVHDDKVEVRQRRISKGLFEESASGTNFDACVRVMDLAEKFMPVSYNFRSLVFIVRVHLTFHTHFAAAACCCCTEGKDC